jgi:hypothetical protein
MVAVAWDKSTWGSGFESFVHYVAFMLALSKFVARHPYRRRLARRDRHAAHEFFITRIGKNKREVDILIPRILKTDPGVGRDENNRSVVNVTFLRAQPNVRDACLNQQDFVLTKMLVLRDKAAGRNFLRT